MARYQQFQDTQQLLGSLEIRLVAGGVKGHQNLVRQAAGAAREHGFAQPGDRLVITAGEGVGWEGSKCRAEHGQPFPYLLCRRHRVHRSHIVQAIRQFENDDTRVFCHRQQHLTNRLHLLSLLISRRNARFRRMLALLRLAILGFALFRASMCHGIELRHAIDNIGDGEAKLLLYVL